MKTKFLVPEYLITTAVGKNIMDMTQVVYSMATISIELAKVFAEKILVKNSKLKTASK